MNTLIRALLARWRGDPKRPYRYKPDLSDAARSTTTRLVHGELLREASDHYHQATMGWMMPASVYERIPLLPRGAEVKLLSYDNGSVRRADGQDWGGDGPDWLLEDVYSIQVCLWVGVGTGTVGGAGARVQDTYGTPMIMPVMASDWDSWLIGPDVATPRAHPTITSFGSDAHGRKMTW